MLSNPSKISRKNNGKILWVGPRSYKKTRKIKKMAKVVKSGNKARKIIKNREKLTKNCRKIKNYLVKVGSKVIVKIGKLLICEFLLLLLIFRPKATQIPAKSQQKPTPKNRPKNSPG
jgi:hypothetical protein